MTYQPLTDLQWSLLEPLFSSPAKRGRGKPHTPWRTVLNSIFWVLATGNKWNSIPVSPEYASKSAAHRWFVIFEKTGKLEEILTAYRCICNIGAPSLPRRRNRLPKAEKEPSFELRIPDAELCFA